MSENKIKSQRGGQVDVFVKNRIKWPHEYVFAGSQKERLFLAFCLRLVPVSSFVAI